jgi:hypothetical protein
MTQKYKYYRLKISIDDSPGNPRKEYENTAMFICNHGRYTLGDEEHHKQFAKGRSLKEIEAALLYHFVPLWGQEVDEYESTLEDENTKEDLLDEFIEHKFDDYFVWQFLYLYDHSGISMSCGMRNPYQCRWDSGVVGMAVIPKSELIAGWGIAPDDDAALQEKGNKIIEQECETYTAYLEGHVFGYELEQVRERRIVGKEKWEKPLVEFLRITEFGGGLFDRDEDEEVEDGEETEIPEGLTGEIEWHSISSCWGFYGDDMDKNGILGIIEDEIGKLPIVKTLVDEAEQDYGKWMLCQVPVVPTVPKGAKQP